MLRLISKGGLRGEAEETLKRGLPNVHNFIVGSGVLACEPVLEKAGELVYNAVTSDHSSRGGD